jgi:hypothetical protein
MVNCICELAWAKGAPGSLKDTMSVCVSRHFFTTGIDRHWSHGYIWVPAQQLRIFIAQKPEKEWVPSSDWAGISILSLSAMPQFWSLQIWTTFHTIGYQASMRGLDMHWPPWAPIFQIVGIPSLLNSLLFLLKRRHFSFGITHITKIFSICLLTQRPMMDHRLAT